MDHPVIQAIRRNIEFHKARAIAETGADREIVDDIFDNFAYTLIKTNQKIDEQTENSVTIIAQTYLDNFLTAINLEPNKHGHILSGNRRYHSKKTEMFVKGAFPEIGLLSEAYMIRENRLNSIFVFLEMPKKCAEEHQAVFARYIKSTDEERMLLENDNLDTQLMLRRIEILKNTCQIPNPTDIDKIDNYGTYAMRMQEQAKLADAQLQASLNKIKACREIEEKKKNISQKSILIRARRFMRAIRQYLCEEDQETIDANPTFDPYSLKGAYHLLPFIETPVENASQALKVTTGIVRAFSKPSQEKLNGYEKVLLGEELALINARIRFAKAQGINIKEISKGIGEDILLTADWHYIDALKDIVPAPEVVEAIEKIRKDVFLDHRLGVANSIIESGVPVRKDNYLCKKVLKLEEGYCYCDGQPVVIVDSLKFGEGPKVVNILINAVRGKMLSQEKSRIAPTSLVKAPNN